MLHHGGDPAVHLGSQESLSSRKIHRPLADIRRIFFGSWFASVSFSQKMVEKEGYGAAAPVNVEVVAPETLNAGYTFDAVFQVRSGEDGAGLGQASVPIDFFHILTISICHLYH